jgi:hypothetical protein
VPQRRRRRPRLPRPLRPNELAADHRPTAVAFLDESGSIARDRFFAVGCLKLAEPSVLLRSVQKLRDRYHWYEEMHFKAVTAGALPFYKDVVRLVVKAEAEFSCFVADRNVHDPVARFGTSWRAYQKLAEQLIVGSIRNRELLTVLADNYSTPDDVRFEEDLRADVNERLGRLAILTVCRLDSESTDALQIVDLLTSAVTFEFRQAAGIASRTNTKAQLAAHVRSEYGVTSFLSGCRPPPLNVAIYGPRASGVQRAHS